MTRLVDAISEYIIGACSDKYKCGPGRPDTYYVDLYFRNVYEHVTNVVTVFVFLVNSSTNFK